MVSTPKLFDIHTHTQFAAFRDDQDAVIQRALDAGVWMINVGTQRDTSRLAIETARRYPEGVYATVGLHPIHTEKAHHDSQELGMPIIGDVISTTIPVFVSRGEEFDYEYYKELAQHSKVVAIGECGLDYYRLSEDTKDKQRATFLKQIELAAEVKKPLMIHCRNAFDDLISLLQRLISSIQPTGVVHFFTGSVEDARLLLDLGFYFSFGGVITFARDYDEVVNYIPLERILVETDAPYVTPVPYRGRRNEPVYVAEIAKKLAEIKSLPPDEVYAITVKNARNLFGMYYALRPKEN